jgi:hypothetical protein
MLLILGFYLFGLKYGPNIKSVFGAEIKAEVLLPIFSLLFYDLWLGALDKVALLSKESHRIDKSDFIISFKFEYCKPVAAKFKLRRLRGISGIPARIDCRNSRGEHVFNDPVIENFEAELSPINSELYFDITYCYRDKVKPTIRINAFNNTYGLYLLLLSYRLGFKNKIKLFLMPVIIKGEWRGK